MFRFRPFLLAIVLLGACLPLMSVALACDNCHRGYCCSYSNCHRDYFYSGDDCAVYQSPFFYGGHCYYYDRDRNDWYYYHDGQRNYDGGRHRDAFYYYDARDWHGNRH